MKNTYYCLSYNRVKKYRTLLLMKICCVLFLVLYVEELKADDNRIVNGTAQQMENIINGKVTDVNGEPIIGATILEKGSTNGTVTNDKGEFELKVSSRAVIQISFIGYTSQEVVASNKKNLNIVLEEDLKLLSEVVVVGYGTMKKRDLTGAIASVQGADLAARKTTQLSTALQGAAAGLMVTRENSAPGATANIRIRGITTMGDTSPLVIVDGVQGDINQINPEDVENITVLKDAASASIYGSKAAAGVIVVTTKRASEKSLKLNYNFSCNWELPTERPEYVSVGRFMEMVNEIRYNDNNKGGWNQTYSEDQINNWVEYNKTDPDKYPLTDWRSELLKKSALRMTHSVDVSGGSKNVRSKASFRYDKADALYANRTYERFMLRMNNDFTINKYLKATLDASFKRSVTDQPHGSPYSALDIPSIYAVRWSNGLWGDVKDGGNVKAVLEDGGNKQNWNHLITGKAGLDVMPITDLKISAVVAARYTFDKNKNFSKRVPYTYADDPNRIRGYASGHSTTKLSESRNDSYNITTQFFANYAKEIGEHDFTLMAGYEDYYAFWEYLGASRDQYILENFPYLTIGPELLRDNSGSAEEYASHSLFGRLTYSFKNRYLFQANFRRDASSRFSKKNRWGNFPSFSAGWVVSEEKFFKKMHLDWVPYLKLRGSWGRLGNERISSLYPYQASVGFGTALLTSGNEVISVPTAAQTTYAVHDITWETTETFDIGIDAHFFEDRLSLTADWYKKETKDMLLPLEIPKYIGYGNPSVNAGKMHTTGYDIELAWRDVIGDFSYSASINFSDFVSKMGNLSGTEFLGDQIKREGSEFNEWYGYLSDGLFLTQEDLDNSPKLNANTKLGDIKYKDISGPDGVPDGKISSEYDRVLLGGSLPRYMFGGNLNAAYKSFDLGLTFQGIGRRWTRFDRAMVEPLKDNWKTFSTQLDGNYWSEKNTDEQNAHIKYPRLTVTNKNSNLTMSDYWLFKGRYVRLKNLTVGYTVPSVYLEKIGINHLRVYVAANDLFCWNNFPKGWDPESSTSMTYPITTSVLFGLSVSF